MARGAGPGRDGADGGAAPERRTGATPPSDRHVPAAVDGDGLAGDVRRVEQQEVDGARDVLGRPFALQRRLRHDALPRQLVELIVVGPQDRARRDGVDAHLGGQLPRERAGEAGEPGLRRRVDDVVLQRTLGVDVGDVDDRAVGLPQRRRRGLRQEQRRLEVGAHQVVPVGGVDLADRRRVERRRVVDQRVEAAVGAERALDQRRQLRQLEQVRLHQRDRIGADAVELGLQQPRFAGRAAVVQHQVRARGVQPAADRRAHALAPPR